MSIEEGSPEVPEVPATTGEEAVNTEASATPESGDTPADKPKKGGVQKRIGELVREREDARREKDYWREQAMKGQPKSEPTKTEEKPKVDQFQSYEDYLEALADYKAEQKFTEREKKREQESQQERAKREFDEVRSTFAERVEQAAEKYEDFEEVAFSENVPISEAMSMAIMSSELGPDLLYHLGQNPKESARIARLPPIAAVRELGKLEAKLSETPTKRASKAPEPIKPVGNRAEVEKDPSDMSPKEFAAWRKKIISAR